MFLSLVFVQRVSRGPWLRCHGVQECILLVTQRISKYPVLVQRILDNTTGESPQSERLYCEYKARTEHPHSIFIHKVKPGRCKPTYRKHNRIFSISTHVYLTASGSTCVEYSNLGTLHHPHNYTTFLYSIKKLFFFCTVFDMQYVFIKRTMIIIPLYTISLFSHGAARPITDTEIYHYVNLLTH